MSNSSIPFDFPEIRKPEAPLSGSVPQEPRQPGRRRIPFHESIAHHSAFGTVIRGFLVCSGLKPGRPAPHLGQPPLLALEFMAQAVLPAVQHEAVS